MRHFTDKWSQSGHFFPKLGHFFPVYKKRRGDIPALPSLVTRIRRRLWHVISITIFRLPRRLEDVLEDQKLLCWRRLQDVLDTSVEDVLKTFLKTSWIHVFKTSWRRLGDKQNIYWGYLYLTNLNVYLTNLYFTNLYLTNLRWIQNH